MKETKISASDPVTVIVKHRVVKGKEVEYEHWSQGITEAARKFDGYLGVNFIRPSDPESDEYVLIFKFNSYGSMQRWEDSPERNAWRIKRMHLTIDEPEIHRYKGWDYWFTLPPTAKVAPPRYKMALITLFSLYPLALFLPMLLEPLIGCITSCHCCISYRGYYSAFNALSCNARHGEIVFMVALSKIK
jgi:uncharacterized protein